MKPAKDLLVFRRLLASLLIAVAVPVAAQEYPSKPIRMVVPWPAGGGTDIVARIIGAKLTEAWGQSVFIDNKPGATGTIGTDQVAKAVPDGYTLVLGSNSTYVLATGLTKMPYDQEKDLTPISRAGEVPHVLSVNPALPVKSAADLVALARAKPGQIAFVSSGAGSTPHIAGEFFMTIANVQLMHVPYKGGSQSIADVVAGTAQVSFDTLPTVLQFIRANKLRPVAVLSPKRLDALPGIPTIGEAGYKGAETVTWFGLYGPAGLPGPIVRKLHDEVVKIMQLPDVKLKLDAISTLDTSAMTPDEVGASVRAELAKYSVVLKKIKVKND